MKRLNLVNSSTVFMATIMVLAAIIVIVYSTGIESHRSLYQNALITTTILFLVFFCFISWGLYQGWKLRETMGNFRKYFGMLPKPEQGNSEAGSINDFPLLDMSGDNAEGCLIGLVLWFIVAVFGTLILWFIGAFFWGILLVLAALIYWLTFRAFRLIFKNSRVCQGNFWKSLGIAGVYSVLYASWIYAVIFAAHYFL